MGVTTGFSILVTAFQMATALFELPPGLLSAVCYVESNHRIHAIHRHDGDTDSYGVCQIKLEVAQSLGYKGTIKELRHNPVTNTFYAGKLLRYQLDRYKNDPRKAVSAYNMGRYKGRHGNPVNNKYVTKVFKAWSQYK